MKIQKRHFRPIKTVGICLVIAASLVFGVPASYQNARADSPLVGYWKFDEGTGSVATDSSSYGNNGAISGGATYSSAKVAPTNFANPNSLLFDGLSGQIAVPDNSVLDLTGDMTAMAWVYWNGPKINPAPMNDDHVLFDKSGGGVINYRLIIKQTGQMVFYTGGSGGFANSGTNYIPQDEWALVNFTVESGAIKLYINGTQVGSGSGGVGTVNNGPLYIGRDEISRFFNGYIDEVRLYNYALSPDEVQSIADGGYGAGNEDAMFAGGTGTELDPWQITDCMQLQAIGANNTTLVGDYILADDIDCSETVGWNSGDGFEPIGDNSNSFVGHLDGNGKIITDLYINRPASEKIGLFGLIDTNATISDLGLQDVAITGESSTGALAGEVWLANVDNVWSSGSVIGGDHYVGGLVGYHSEYGNITNSYTDTDVIGDYYYVGGLAGYSSGAIENSYAMGVVGGTEGIGGLVGYHDTDGTIRRSYALGEVSGSNTVGGLVGEHYGTIEDSYALGDVHTVDWGGGLVGYSEGPVARSYSIGSVTGITRIGGLIGEHSSGLIENSFWDTQASGKSESDGGEGKTTAEMKTIVTFADASWDVELSDTNLNNGYPFLAWQAGDDTPVWYVFKGTANVMSFTSPLTNNQVTLEVDEACEIEAASIAAESTNAVQDSGFNYPLGLMNFTVDCGTPGYTTTVTQYYYGATNGDFVLRKHNPGSSAYFTVPGATVEQITIDGQAVLKVVYHATDGGDLDVDGVTNGIIVDPVGPAQNVVGTPNTGLGRIH